MATVDFPEQIKELGATLTSIEKVLDLDAMRAEIAKLQEEVGAPDLWDDQTNAQRVTGRLSTLQADLERITGLRQRLDDLEIMVQLGQEEDDADCHGRGRDRARAAAHRRSTRSRSARCCPASTTSATPSCRSAPAPAASTRPTSPRCCSACTSAGPSGTSTRVEIYDVSYAEEAGLKSTTFAIKAPYAYGTLSVEAGTHRLVRISPFDNQGRRQTSFAAVEVVPVLEETDEIDIPDEEIRVDVYRSSGPGGQSVNTTDSAVRLTHIPTGVVVSCQNEKSQLQNKASAMVILKAKLLALKKAEERAQLDELRGDVQASWGDQMRNYVLNPYQMVKDLRTEHETGNTQAVLDGEIDDFIEAGIRWRRAQEAVA